MKAIVLAAGYGTRLYPLTERIAKSLLPLGKRTILDFILDRMDGLPGVDEIVVASNHKFFDDFRAWAETREGRTPVRVTDDGTSSNEDRLGAIGEVAFVVREHGWSEDVLVVGGDNVFEFGLGVLLADMRRRSAAVVGVYDMKDAAAVAGKYGVLLLGKDRRIEGFEEKPARPRSTLISTACYALPADDVRELIAYSENKELPDNLGEFVRHLAERRPVFGLPFGGRWIDIGSPQEYERAKEILGN